MYQAKRGYVKKEPLAAGLLGNTYMWGNAISCYASSSDVTSIFLLTRVLQQMLKIIITFA